MHSQTSTSNSLHFFTMESMSGSKQNFFKFSLAPHILNYSSDRGMSVWSQGSLIAKLPPEYSFQIVYPINVYLSIILIKPKAVGDYQHRSSMHAQPF
ncbi:hypothetical protein FGO68_gene16564 [Halteria grandinella]|uniref:Uncharacterized protein n=1 Tax=Halteria grandinella TaxID=5974 RepID=A0A8J8P479_HALGN|nr:hypothetical protein FGO68_gene16564 [Halteria grandinella]